MRYTIEELNNRHPYKIVCEVKNKKQHNHLKSICPKISNYDEKYKAYLLCNSGLACTLNHYGYDYTKITYEELMEKRNYEIWY